MSRPPILRSARSVRSVGSVGSVLLVLLLAACGGPHVTVAWHKSQPVQGEPEPRTSLVEMLKYGAAAVSPEVACVIAVEKIVSGVSADWRTHKGETLLVRVPAPNGAAVAYKSNADGRPDQLMIAPVVRARDAPERPAALARNP